MRDSCKLLHQIRVYAFLYESNDRASAGWLPDDPKTPGHHRQHSASCATLWWTLTYCQNSKAECLLGYCWLGSTVY